MAKNGDQATPLWITEIGWGSAPAGPVRDQPGADGQNEMLKSSFGLILSHQKEWNVGRLFWFDWRDPSKSGVVKCSFCASAGLLRYDRTRSPPTTRFAFYSGRPAEAPGQAGNRRGCSTLPARWATPGEGV